MSFEYCKTSGYGNEMSDFGIVWSDGKGRCIFGVADGYSGELGKKVSSLLTQFVASSIEDGKEKITVETVVTWISSLFDRAEEYLSDEIIQYFEKNQFETKSNRVNDENIIYFRDTKSPMFVDRHVWQPIDSGCSFTMVVIIDDHIFTANVGHCGAILFSDKECFEEHDVGMLFDAAMKDIYTFRGEYGFKKTRNLILTCNQSPTSWYEYCRIKGSPKGSSLQFVYDIHPSYVQNYLPIFPEDISKKPKKQNYGHYYKNVEKEFGAVVMNSVGPKRLLNTTRGFLNNDLKPFGVTHKPAITLTKLKEDSNVTLFIGTNGVFDNWIRTYERAEEIGTDKKYVLPEFFSDPSMTLANFMDQNLEQNKINFKDNYDEACGILVRLNSKTSIPSTTPLTFKAMHISQICSSSSTSNVLFKGSIVNCCA